MKNVLLTAFIGSSNLGDQAIFTSICQSLSKNKNLRLSAFTLDRTKHKGTPYVRFIQTYNPIRIVEEIRRCDVLVIGGGAIIQDNSSVYNLLRHTYKALIANILGKPYMFYAVGVNKLQSSGNRLFAKFTFNAASAITVRDQRSKENLEQLGVSKQIIVTSDPAVNLHILHEKRKDKASQPYVIVCLQHCFDINRYIPVALMHKFHLRSGKDNKKYQHFVKIIAEFLDWIIDTYTYRIVFLPFYNQRDDKVQREIFSFMQHKEQCILLEKQQTVERTMALIQGARVALSMRYHAAIFSAMHHVPFIGLRYSEKVSNFLAEAGMSRFGVDPKLTDLKYCFRAMYKETRSIKANLRIRMNVLKQKEMKNREILEHIIFG